MQSFNTSSAAVSDPAGTADHNSSSGFNAMANGNGSFWVAFYSVLKLFTGLATAALIA